MTIRSVVRIIVPENAVRLLHLNSKKSDSSTGLICSRLPQGPLSQDDQCTTRSFNQARQIGILRIRIFLELSAIRREILIVKRTFAVFVHRSNDGKISIRVGSDTRQILFWTIFQEVYL